MLDLTAIFSQVPVLETERCILRAITLEDAPALLEIMGDPQVNQHLGRPPMQSLDEAIKRIETLHTSFTTQTAMPWAITERASGQLMGTVAIHSLVPAHFRGEFGYTIAPQWWGKGIMTEVATVVLDFTFNTLGLHSLEAIIAPQNIASRRVLEKQGFVQEGYYRESFFNPVTQRFEDDVVFSLLKADWEKRKS